MITDLFIEGCDLFIEGCCLCICVACLLRESVLPRSLAQTFSDTSLVLMTELTGTYDRIEFAGTYDRIEKV